MKIKKIFLGLMLFSSISMIQAEEIYFIFDIEPLKESSLSLKESGIVNNVYKNIGDKIKKDELLLELENEEIKVNYKLAINNTEQARNKFEYSEEDYNRYNQVKDSFNIDVFNKYKREYKDNNLNFSIAKNNELKAKIKLDNTYLKSPYNGLIIEKNVEKGDSVSALNKTLFKIIDDSKSKLILSFDQMHRAKVKIGQQINYKLDGDKEFKKAKITKIYPYSNTNRKIKAEAIIPFEYPNIFGEGFILVDKK